MDRYNKPQQRCQNCDCLTDDIVSNGLCESCWTSKQEQISAYGSNSCEVNW